MQYIRKDILLIAMLIFIIPFLGILFSDLFDMSIGVLYTFRLSLKDFFTVWITIFGVFGVVLNIHISRQRLDVQQERMKLQEKSERDARFTKGIELLGNANSSSRTGASYVLFFLAREFKNEYSKEVFEILCSHIRIITSDKMYKDRFNKKPSAEIQIIIDLLFKKKDGEYIFEEYGADLRNTFLRGVNIDYGQMAGSNMIESDLTAASLCHTDFSNSKMNRVIFDEGNLTGTMFIGTLLSNTRFRGLSEASPFFNYSHMRYSTFIDIEFDEGTSFIGSNLAFSNFENTNLSYVNFTGARFFRAKLKKTCLEGTNFSYVNIKKIDWQVDYDIFNDKHIERPDLSSCIYIELLNDNYLKYQKMGKEILFPICITNYQKVRDLIQSGELKQ